jgi:hypothetical protein
MEGFKPENNSELATDREKIVALAKEKGYSDPETRALFLEWSRKSEEAAAPSSKGSLEHIINEALLYEEMGEIALAITSLEDSLLFAYHAHEDELQVIMEAHLERLDAQLEK